MAKHAKARSRRNTAPAVAPLRRAVEPDGSGDADPAGPAQRTAIEVRTARAADMAQVVALDGRVTGLAKPDYWREVFQHVDRRQGRYFLVAESRAAASARQVLGFILGEVRAWEFGSAPCGWVIALSVETRARRHGIGQALFEALSNELRKAGVDKLRTMIARDNRLHLMFFRSAGMMAGPYLQLEKELD
jgi:ribosomal protein S18 acetylase RimI-like enzyme